MGNGGRVVGDVVASGELGMGDGRTALSFGRSGRAARGGISRGAVAGHGPG